MTGRIREMRCSNSIPSCSMNQNTRLSKMAFVYEILEATAGSKNSIMSSFLYPLRLQRGFGRRRELQRQGQSDEAVQDRLKLISADIVLYVVCRFVYLNLAPPDIHTRVAGAQYAFDYLPVHL